MNVDIEELKGVFFEEASDQLAEMEANLLNLEAGADPDLLNSIFRCAHSIKGGSGTFAMTDVTQFTHGLETLLDSVRKGQIEVTTALTDLLLRSVDHMTNLLAVERGERTEPVETQPMLDEISAIIDEQSLGGNEVFDEDAFRAEVAAMLALESIELAAEADDFFADEPAEIPTEVIAETHIADSDVIEIVGEVDALEPDPVAIPVAAPAPTPALAIVTTPVEQAPAKPEPVQTREQSAGRRKADNVAKSDNQVLRIPTEKVDKLINLVGELVIHQAILNDIAANFTPDKAPQLSAAVTDVARATRELQERVMAVRMLPIKQAFARFSRLVHDLSASCGKKIELRTAGEDTELDKTLIEGIADPLTHLVRNSIDHGIESPVERLVAGKPEIGHINLTACHEGGNIIIEVSDDGKGLDRDKILAKAKQNGLVADGDVLTDEQVYSLIYQPGFSTADKVTDISGRGVGMDIVVSSIRALGGTVTLSSTPGSGTKFRVRLPLTMAILEGLTLSVHDEVYILPLTSILESIRPRAEDIHHLAGRGHVVTLRSESLPIVRLHELFDIGGAITDCTEGLLVIIENDGHKAALLVDELIGQSQVVVKSLESNYRKVEGVAGATILGNGRVGLILDVPALINHSLGRQNTLSMAA